MPFYGDQPEAIRAIPDHLLRVIEADQVHVRRAGAGHVACCPFHGERSPSLHVYDDGHFHCFGCGAHGDAFAYVMLRQGVTFPEAVQRVAEAVGFRLEDQATPAAAADAAERDTVRRLTAWAVDQWEAALWTTADGERARAYLAERGLSAATLRTWRIGWADAGGGLAVRALAAGIPAAQLELADLARPGRGGDLIDTVRGRIVVPICDGAGAPIAWTARIAGWIADEAAARGAEPPPKYINTRETPAFKKGRTVFALHRARQHARHVRRVVLVEGALDVIAAHQAGIAETVCGLGTAFTAEQAQAVAALGQRVIVAMDGDAAGERAAPQAVGRLLAAAASAAVAEPSALAPAKDLAEALAQADGGARVRAMLDAAAPGLPVWLRSIAPQPDALDDRERLLAFDRVAAGLAGCPDADLRLLHLEAACAHLGLRKALARTRGIPAAQAAAERPDARPRAHAAANRPAAIPIPAAAGAELNNEGDARRLLAVRGQDLRYVQTWGAWVAWTGTHWKIDESGQVVRWMAEAIRGGIVADIEAAASHEESKELAAYLNKAMNHVPLMHAIKRAEHLAEFVATADQFDADPWALSVRNGTLDLRTGELRPHRREDLITRLCDIAYDPAARDGRWDEFLGQITGGDELYAAFLGRVAGYCTTGMTTEDAIFMSYGPGGTGKTTFTSTLQLVLGGFSDNIPFDTWLRHPTSIPAYSLAVVEKARLVVSEESAEGQAFNSALLKDISSGASIQARHPYGRPYSYRPRWKLWMVSNERPQVSDTDSGFWRRFVPLPFLHVPAVKNDIKQYLRESPQAHAAVLAWIVRGAAAYAARGLDAPASIIQARTTYRAEMDPLKEWADDCTRWAEPHEADGRFIVPRSDVRANYVAWCAENGTRALSPRRFCERLRTMGADDKGGRTQRVNGQACRAWSGFRLVDAANEPSPANTPQPGFMRTAGGAGSGPNLPPPPSTPAPSQASAPRVSPAPIPAPTPPVPAAATAPPREPGADEDEPPWPPPPSPGSAPPGQLPPRPLPMGLPPRPEDAPPRAHPPPSFDSFLPPSLS